MRPDETMESPLFAAPGAVTTTVASAEPDATRGAEDRTAAVAMLERGEVVGRYVVLDRIGAGAMGVVYAAFDPELDRKVALKLLQPASGAPATPASAADTTASARLLREAQALARLAHPNVVAVHDVGTRGDQVWIAMEFVAGQTLGRWMRAQRRGWREVVELLRSAGRGLAAAHAAGLIHRDFKPDNVMIGDDGRARVMDFGLARRGDAAPPPRDGPPRPQAALAVDFTLAGTLLGTPAYMAPEQFTGREVGPKADQFALCVTLWEALHGERPFAGATMTTLAANVKAGVLRAPPRRTGVPGWLRRVTERGLAVDPERRWPSVDALLAALERGQARARLRAGGALLAGVAALGLGGWLGQRAAVAGRVARCEALGAGVERVWNDAARTRMDGALRATGLAYAGWAAEHVLPWLDAWARQWRAVRTATCERSDVERAWEPGLRARADECLDERLQAFAALVEALSTGDVEVVGNAVTAAADLTAASGCGDAGELSRRPALPAGGLGELRTIRAALARARALQDAGKLAAAGTAGMAALARAEAFDWAPLTAEAQLQVGRLFKDRGEFKRAAVTLESAYFTAAMASTDETATDAAIVLAYVAGERLARLDEGRRWARLAQVGLSELGVAHDSLRNAAHVDVLGHLARNAGDLAEARRRYQEELAIFAATVGEAHPRYASSLNNLATVEGALGDQDEARRLLARAVAIHAEILGPDHPSVGLARNNLGTALARAGLLAPAKEEYLQALAIRERALGPDHSDVADTLTNLASVQFLLGELAAVEPLFARALAIKEKALGPDHPDLAETLNNLGFVATRRGRFTEARALLARALAINQRSHDDRHAAVAMNLRNLALAELGDGGDVQAARGLLARAVVGSSPAQLAELRFALARALWPADRAQARALAEQAREGHVSAPARAQQLAEVDAWLQAHAP